MKTNYIDVEKLNGMMKEVWEIAVSKGWHDRPISKEQFLGLVVTEAAETVKADRKGKMAKTDMAAGVILTLVSVPRPLGHFAY